MKGNWFEAVLFYDSAYEQHAIHNVARFIAYIIVIRCYIVYRTYSPSLVHYCRSVYLGSVADSSTTQTTASRISVSLRARLGRPSVSVHIHS